MTNTKLYLWHYQYVFVISDDPLPYNIRFIDIELQNGKRILFEFDDSEKFVKIFKQRTLFQSVPEVNQEA